jgi:hypothetical protein
MPRLQQPGGTGGDGDGLILTPSKLRLHSCVFGPYITCLWLPNGILAALLLLKARWGGGLLACTRAHACAQSRTARHGC